ncbi:MAG: NlpC/P60 family protein [Paracoccaceae bacterium]
MMDKRRIPFRHDLAAEHLRGQVDVENFVEGKPMMVGVSLLNLSTNANPATAMATQLLFGEGFTVYDEIPDMGLSWGQSDVDGYVGYVASAGLVGPVDGEAVRVTAMSALIYAKPDYKSQPIGSYSLGCRVVVEETKNGYARLGDGMFTPVVNLAPIVGDFVDVAEKFVGTPYLWGGRSAFGLDCSGLVQIALQAVGVDAPRDSDMQQAELGEGVKDSLTRGDLVILDGHVGIMLNGENVLHANVHHMAVVSEPLADVILRVGEVVERRRLTTD